MKGLNKVMLIGRLGKNPELRYTSNGQPVAKFSLATDESWIDKNGKRQNRPEWHNIVAWGKLAEICSSYLKKGSLVYLEGRIQTRNWEDNSGNRRYTTEIIISDMSMLDTKASSDQSASSKSEDNISATIDNPMTDDEALTDAPIIDEVDEGDVPF